MSNPRRTAKPHVVKTDPNRWTSDHPIWWNQTDSVFNLFLISYNSCVPLLFIFAPFGLSKIVPRRKSQWQKIFWVCFFPDHTSQIVRWWKIEGFGIIKLRLRPVEWLIKQSYVCRFAKIRSAWPSQNVSSDLLTLANRQTCWLWWIRNVKKEVNLNWTCHWEHMVLARHNWLIWLYLLGIAQGLFVIEYVRRKL